MKFEYEDNQNTRYELTIDEEKYPNHIDIIVRRSGGIGGYAWLHQIKDGKIVWRQDGFPYVADEAKQWIQRAVKLLVFM